MFTNIVWATDGSEHADRAFEYACSLARDQNATLHAVHVVETLVGPRFGGENTFLSEGQIDARIRRQVDQAGEMLGSVTQRLLHLAPCPILAIPPLTALATAPSRFAPVAATS